MQNMVEVTIDSIRVSLMSPHRLVILKDMVSERFLPIWIGLCESDAITAELQGQGATRPLTHDLLKNMISTLGGRVLYIAINDLRDDVFYARIVIELAGRNIEVDSRPSDALALGVRVRVPIYVHDSVMDRAAIMPDQEIESDPASPPPVEAAPADDRLSIFQDFLDTLDFDEDEDDK